MKYKEKYLELQVQHFNKMMDIRKGYSDIMKISSYIDTCLDGHRDELSPELCDILRKRIFEICQICRRNDIYTEDNVGCSTNIGKGTGL
jgi:hypothetical protein